MTREQQPLVVSRNLDTHTLGQLLHSVCKLMQILANNFNLKGYTFWGNPAYVFIKIISFLDVERSEDVTHEHVRLLFNKKYSKCIIFNLCPGK